MIRERRDHAERDNKEAGKIFILPASLLRGMRSFLDSMKPLHPLYY